MKMKKSNNRLFLFRVLGEKVDAKKMMHLTEFGVSHEAESEQDDTMDGSFTTGDTFTSTISGTAKMAHNDPFADEVEDATVDRVPYEAWEIEEKVKDPDSAEPKFKAKYYQGYFNSYDLTGEVNGVDEYEMEFGVYGRYQRGYTAIPDSVEQALAKAGYRFHEAIASDFADDGLAEIPQAAEPVIE